MLTIRPPRRRILASLLLTFAWAAASIPTASAAPSTQVTGRQVAVDTCDGRSGAVATFVMTGDLEGCWYLDEFEPRAATPSGFFVGAGRETFVGCIGSRCGTLTFSFVFIGQYDVTGAEIRGACHHPITGGTGGLAGASGAINFVDDPDGSGLPPADYMGRVHLPN